MKAAARNESETDLVVRCANVQRNVFNEATCRISFHEDACTSVPLPDPNDFYRINMYDPGEVREDLWKYLPAYRGPNHGGVVGEFTRCVRRLLYFMPLMSGLSRNQFVDQRTRYHRFPQKTIILIQQIARLNLVQLITKHRKLQHGLKVSQDGGVPINHIVRDVIHYFVYSILSVSTSMKYGIDTLHSVKVILSAEDQLCQRLAFGLSKIFATSTTMNADSFNTGR
jgi:hypothetical protein